MNVFFNTFKFLIFDIMNLIAYSLQIYAYAIYKFQLYIFHLFNICTYTYIGIWVDDALWMVRKSDPKREAENCNRKTHYRKISAIYTTTFGPDNPGDPLHFGARAYSCIHTSIYMYVYICTLHMHQYVL